MLKQKVFFAISFTALAVVFGVSLSFFGGDIAQAGLSGDASFRVLPATSGTDNLVGANATWSFSVTTTAALAPGDIIGFVFPTVGQGGTPFGTSSATTTLVSGISLFQNASGTLAGVLVGNGGTTVYGYVTSTIATSTVFTVNIGLITNSTGMLSAYNNLTWQLVAGTPTGTFAGNGAMAVTKMTKTAVEPLVRAGGPLVSDFYSSITPSNYAVSATNVSYTFRFSATTSIPVGGKIILNFPSIYDLSTASTTLNAALNTSSSPARVASMVTSTGPGVNRIILITGANTTSAHDVITAVVRVTNPATAAVYRPFSVFTTKSNNGLIDGSYFGFESGDYSMNPPVDTVHIGGTNTITINVVKESGATTVPLSGSELTQVLVGVGCPDKQFFVGNKWLNASSSITLNNLLDCNYMIGTPPATTGDANFFKSFLQPSLNNINATNGTVVTTTITFGIPDTTTTLSLTNGVPGQQAFVRAFSSRFESFTPVFTDTNYVTSGFSNAGVGFARLQLKSGQNWGFNVSGGSFGGGSNFSTGTTKYWPPSIPSTNITTSGTLALGAFSFVAASNTLDVTLTGGNGSTVNGACIGVKRTGAGMFMEFQDQICAPNNGGSYRFRVPYGNISIGVMRPGFPPDEYPVGITSATTTKAIVISNPTNFISVTVLDASSNPINGAPIFAESTSGGNFVNGMTGSAGTTTLYVQPGTYTVRGFAPGFGALSSQNATVASNSNPSVSFTVDSSSFRTISGRVFIDVNSNGAYNSGTDTPISGFQIGARGTGGTNGGNGAATLSDGTYTLFVPSGSYLVGGWSEDTGGLPEQAANASSGNVTDLNFVVARQSTLQVTVTNGATVNPLFVGAFSTSTGRGNGTDSWTTSGTSKIARMNLPAGNYEVHVGSPLLGEIGNTTTILVANTVTSITLNAQSNVSLVTISGSVGAVPNATVWASRVAGPGFFSTTTDSSGNYTLLVPASRTYNMGVRMQGYVVSGGDVAVVVGAGNATQNFTLTTAGASLIGTVTAGGSALSRAWVSAKKSGTDYWAGGETDGSGNFSIGVDSGTWTVYAEGPCYFRSSGTSMTAGGASTTIALTATSGCTVPTTNVNAVTPANGGQVSSQGMTLNIPANALGTGQSSVSLSVSKASLVVGSTNATPIPEAVQTVSASDSSGQSVTSLNSSVSIALEYTEADLPIGFDDSTLQLGYWNDTTGQWEAVAATVDTINHTISASVNHFTDFGPILPGVPSTVTGLTATAASASAISLSWTAEPTATSYVIYRNTSGTSTFSESDEIGTAAGTSYSNTSLSASTQYYYTVAGVNSNGEGLNSALANATTNAAAVVSSSGGGGSSPAASSVTFSTTSSTVDTVIGTLRINAGATSTSNRAVILSLNATNAATMIIANTDNFVGLSFVPYATTTNWVLAPGNGVKTVFVLLRTSSGGTVTVSASINLTGLGSEVVLPQTPATIAHQETLTVALLTLKSGNKGVAVAKLQDFLRKAGFFKVKSNGIFGPATLLAVKNYQKAHKLKESGAVEYTNAPDATNEFFVTPKPVVKPAVVVKKAVLFAKDLTGRSRGADVTKLQDILRAQKYLSAKSNGIFGPQTTRGLKLFQKARKLKVTGIVDRATRDALNSL